MNTAQAADTIHSTSLQFLAAKYGISESDVLHAMENNQDGLLRQWAELVALGVEIFRGLQYG